jgi:hypothetical protein
MSDFISASSFPKQIPHRSVKYLNVTGSIPVLCLCHRDTITAAGTLSLICRVSTPLLTSSTCSWIVLDTIASVLPTLDVRLSICCVKCTRRVANETKIKTDRPKNTETDGGGQKEGKIQQQSSPLVPTWIKCHR